MAEDSPAGPRAFICGYPVTHSRSPLIHNYWLGKLGLPGRYERMPVAPGDLAGFMEDLRTGAAGFVGGNFTIPHKEAVFALADDVDETARQIGAANTVRIADNRVFATNTDALGFAGNLDAGHPGWDRGRTALVFGAGGGSRAVLRALLDRGFSEIRLVNRTIARARELADRFGGGIVVAGDAALQEMLSGADLFVNTTSLGMGGSAVPDLDFTVMAEGALVTDIVYIPLRTPFLEKAAETGLATVDGLGMLLHQAAPAFQLWFGQRPEVTEELRRLVVADMAEAK